MPNRPSNQKLSGGEDGAVEAQFAEQRKAVELEILIAEQSIEMANEAGDTKQSKELVRQKNVLLTKIEQIDAEIAQAKKAQQEKLALELANKTKDTDKDGLTDAEEKDNYKDLLQI